MYNAENYIGNCLDSIINSDLPRNNYEIIIVDDGSKDNGVQIAQNYATNYTNIYYLSQENQGQSTARNNGIKKSNGEYVWCVDADDILDKNILGIIELLDKNIDLDILAFKLRQVSEAMEFRSINCDQPTIIHNKIMKGREAIINGYNPSSVCALVIRKDFLIKNGLFFKAGITHQDVELSYRLFAKANNVLFSDLIPYIYILHPNSTSQSINPQKKIKYLSDDITIIDSFKKLAEYVKDDNELYSTINKRIRNIQLGMVLNLYRNRKVWKPLGINRTVIENMKEAELYPLSGNFGNWKKNLIKLFLNIENFIA